MEKPDNENLCAGFMVITAMKTREFFNTDNIPRVVIMNGLYDQGYINSEKENLIIKITLNFLMGHIFTRILNK